jgi:glycosyltransferase involved in cell wall biosynthesis
MSGAQETTLAAVRMPRRSFSRPTVVLPAFNAASTLEATIADIPPGAASEIILVDDCSADDTVPIARSLGLTVIQHERQGGYGANQKTCYDAALARGADVVIMLHPDYQYDARLIPLFIGFMELGLCDVMLGSRVRTRREALACGMPPYKYLSNRVLTAVENMLLGQNLGEFHSGDFVFDTEFLVQAVYFGFRLADAPVPCRYFEEASSINFRRSMTYGWRTLVTLGKYMLQKGGLTRFPIFVPQDRTGRPG